MMNLIGFLFVLLFCPLVYGQQQVTPPDLVDDLAFVYSDEPSSETVYYRVKPGDTLGKIAKAYGTTVELIKKKNSLKNNKIKDDQYLLLLAKPFQMHIIKHLNQLKLEFNGRLIKVYPISTGKAQTTTPLGQFEIRSRYPNPIWFHHGDIVPAGSPKNFLGTRWLGFNIPQYGIHGTIYPELIGQSVSGGCVRMKNQDIEELYAIIPIGTKVSIEE